MGSDALVIKGASTSAATVLTLFSRNMFNTTGVDSSFEPRLPWIISKCIKISWYSVSHRQTVSQSVSLMIRMIFCSRTCCYKSCQGFLENILLAYIIVWGSTGCLNLCHLYLIIYIYTPKSIIYIKIYDIYMYIYNYTFIYINICPHKLVSLNMWVIEWLTAIGLKFSM